MGDIDQVTLGRFGVWTAEFETQPAAEIRRSIRDLEQQGWKALWFPESRGREALSLAGYLLSQTTSMTIVNGIARVWSREAKWTHGGALLLADAYPHRHVLGLGFGDVRPGLKPMEKLNTYLDELDAQVAGSATPVPIHRLLAAYGPRMLELARDRSAGAHTYHVNVSHTRIARQLLGPDAFLGVEHAVLFETDPILARGIARAHLSPFLSQRYNLAKFRRLGYTEADVTHGGSDRFVDDLVFWGDLDSIQAGLDGHLHAGADHVAVQVIGIKPGQSAMPHWRALGQALLEPRR